MFSIICNVRGLGLFHESFRLKICAAWFFVGAIVSVQAQPEHALGSWQLSSSWQNYSESQMNLKGPELDDVRADRDESKAHRKRYDLPP